MKTLSAVVWLSTTVLVFSCSGFKSWKLRREAETVISKIEHFKTDNSRLPNSLAEIGVVENEEGPTSYRKLSEASYQIWFGTDLRESSTYNSDNKKWNP